MHIRSLSGNLSTSGGTFAGPKKTAHMKIKREVVMSEKTAISPEMSQNCQLNLVANSPNVLFRDMGITYWCTIGNIFCKKIVRCMRGKCLRSRFHVFHYCPTEYNIKDRNDY
jgi:hypothetical protein